jgi:uncharacterized protein YndB with AHSA1/START domain
MRVTTSDPLRFQVRIDAGPEAVFQALTDTDTLTEWFAESAEVDLDGRRYTFWGRYTPFGDRPRQELTAAESGRALRFTWTLPDGETSTVAVELAGTDGGTVVTVDHTGVGGGREALNCFWYVSLANLVAHCEGVATMPPFDFSAPAQGAALVRTVIDVPAEETFASLLDPTQVDKWAKGKATIDASVGGRYDFGWEQDGPVEIVELERDKVLAYSWRHAEGPETLVRWQLRETRGSTYLTLVHSGFDDDGVAEQFRQGWPGHLVEIKRILELGDTFEPLART